MKKEDFPKSTKIEKLTSDNFEDFLKENEENIDYLLEHANDKVDNCISGDFEEQKNDWRKYKQNCRPKEYYC